MPMNKLILEVSEWSKKIRTEARRAEQISSPMKTMVNFRGNINACRVAASFLITPLTEKVVHLYQESQKSHPPYLFS